jgi:hypothetical protein
MVGIGHHAANAGHRGFVARDADRSLSHPPASAQLIVVPYSDQVVGLWVKVCPMEIGTETHRTRRVRPPRELFPLFEVVGLNVAIGPCTNLHREQRICPPRSRPRRPALGSSVLVSVLALGLDRVQAPGDPRVRAVARLLPHHVGRR